MRHAAYGLALDKNNGWIGHSGAASGYLSLSVYLPSQKATVVVLINSNVNNTSLLSLAKAITKIITPKHVYDIVPTTP